MLLPSEPPMLAAISLTASISMEPGMKMPSWPSLSNTESSTGMIVPPYSIEETMMPSRSPCTLAAPTMTVFLGITISDTLIASSRRRRTVWPSVIVWSEWTHADMVFLLPVRAVPTAVLKP